MCSCLAARSRFSFTLSVLVILFASVYHASVILFRQQLGAAHFSVCFIHLSLRYLCLGLYHFYIVIYVYVCYPYYYHYYYYYSLSLYQLGFCCCVPCACPAGSGVLLVFVAEYVSCMSLCTYSGVLASSFTVSLL